MRRAAKMLLVSVAAFVAADTAFAQVHFISTPEDSITATVSLGEKKSMMFRQFATGGRTLQLYWKQLTLSIPAQWEASLCDNGTCYTNLPSSGSMNTVWPGDYGLMKLDITPRVNYGSAIIRYAVWDSSVANLVDTLTWIVHANSSTAISNMAANSPVAFAANKMLFITGAGGREASLYDAAGKSVFRKSLLKQDEKIDLSSLNDGLYILRIASLYQPYAQKIFIGASR